MFSSCLQALPSHFYLNSRDTRLNACPICRPCVSGQETLYGTLTPKATNRLKTRTAAPSLQCPSAAFLLTSYVAKDLSWEGGREGGRPGGREGGREEGEESFSPTHLGKYHGSHCGEPGPGRPLGCNERTFHADISEWKGHLPPRPLPRRRSTQTYTNVGAC